MAHVLASFGLVAAIVVLAHAFGVTMCPLKRWLSIPCPTCGTTRAAIHALGGNVAEAFRMQPLGMVVAVSAGPVALLAALLPRFRGMLSAAARRWPAWVLAGVAIALNWAWVLREWFLSGGKWP